MLKKLPFLWCRSRGHAMVLCRQIAPKVSQLFFHVFICQTYFVRICISSFFHTVRRCVSSITALFKDLIFVVLTVVRNGLGTSIPPYFFTSFTPVNVECMKFVLETAVGQSQELIGISTQSSNMLQEV